MSTRVRIQEFRKGGWGGEGGGGGPIMKSYNEVRNRCGSPV